MANVNEGERWTCLSCGAIGDAQSCRVCGGESMPGDFVPAKALREAREELERLREALEQIAWQGPGNWDSARRELTGAAGAEWVHWQTLAIRALAPFGITNGPSASGSSLASEPKLDGSGR